MYTFKGNKREDTCGSTVQGSYSPTLQSFKDNKKGQEQKAPIRMFRKRIRWDLMLISSCKTKRINEMTCQKDTTYDTIILWLLLLNINI
jgi:hypothetical protein